MQTESQNQLFTIDARARLVSADPRRHDFIQDPYAFYARLHAECPAFFWEDYGHWTFAGWKDVNAFLRDKRFGRQILHVATREELGWAAPAAHVADFDATEAHSLLSLEPPEHTRLRTLVNRAFVSRQVEHLRPHIETLAHELIDGFEDKPEVDLIESFAAPIPVLIIAEMLGVPADMAPQLLLWSHRIVQMYMFNRTRQREDEANTAAREFSEYLVKLADEKRKKPGNDLISYMLSTEHRGQHLTQPELVSTAILLLNAGHEATVHQAGNAIKTILEADLDPARLLADAESVARVVEECLRFDAPLHMFDRFALSDVDLGDGIEISKGQRIGLLLGAANRDPTRFEHPGVFDPARENQANVTFGAGIHFCIGAPLARIELQAALQTLFKRLPGLRLAGKPQYADKFHFHGLERLMARW